MKEFELINKLFKPLIKKTDFAQDLADDVAKISIKDDEELIISKDMICEDVHFLRKDGGHKIASKLLRVNLSDIAASGAKPQFYMLGVSKNDSLDINFLQDFAQGLNETQELFDVSLIGGDTVATKSKNDRLFFSITIFATTKRGQILSRQNAKPGDLIFVSGAIGDAFLGLNINQNSPLCQELNFTSTEKSYLLNRHFYPEPRINLGQKLIEHKLSNCAIDISDGILADLEHICNSSKVSAQIYLDKIPTFFTKKLAYSKHSNLISRGDDYELIFTADAQNFDKIMQLQQEINLQISHIGQISQSKNNKIELFDNSSQKKLIKKQQTGYEH